jgi:hypothetical protein
MALFLSRQTSKLIFGMPPYFDPTRRTMEDNLNIFENGRQPQFFQMEVNLNFVLGNQGADFWYASLFKHNFLKMEGDLNFLKMRDDINFFNGRRPHVF